jgi:protein-L-isoaspartate(D-aspartate) O-methyltransferase
MGFDSARAQLIQSLSREISDARVIGAMMRVPRERFVPAELYSAAYEDHPLDIGYGQTVSQPFIVALMTQALELKGDENVMEVGTGSGYQTAILAELAKKVITVERIPQLIEAARKTLESLGYKNVEMRLAGAGLGCLPDTPYDAIMVTAGAPFVPDVLRNQLKYGGRMVIPVGSRLEQKLLKITKARVRDKVQNLSGCRFVPLIGEDAWKEEFD